MNPLHEAYKRNREQRRLAFKQTDKIIKQMNNQPIEMEIHYEATVAKAQDKLEAAYRSGDQSRIDKAGAELESARNMPGKPNGD